MDYPIRCDRCLMIILLVACVSRVDGRVVQPTVVDAKQDFAVNGSGGGGAISGNQSQQSSSSANALWSAQNAFSTLGRETVNTSHKMLWGVGKFLLSTGESMNFIWDVALNSMLSLLKTGGAAYGAVASKIANVPIVGYGVSGVGEVIRTSLGAAESNARHDMQVRREAFAALSAKLDESGKRLSGEDGAKYAANVATREGGPVRFPGQ